MFSHAPAFNSFSKAAWRWEESTVTTVYFTILGFKIISEEIKWKKTPTVVFHT